MSYEWGLRCKKDDAETNTWFNHGQQILKDCVTAWPEIKKIRDVGSWYLEVQILGRNETELWNFLEEHYEHGVELLNEYGETEPLGVEESIGENHE